MRKLIFPAFLALSIYFAAPAPQTFAQGIEETFWSNGNPKVLGYYDRKKYKDREWKEWYENGKLKKQETYVHGRRHGKVSEWYENGQLRYEQNYQGNVNINGVSIQDNSSIISDGLWTEWHANGEKMKEGKYLNGARE